MLNSENYNTQNIINNMISNKKQKMNLFRDQRNEVKEKTQEEEEKEQEIQDKINAAQDKKELYDRLASNNFLNFITLGATYFIPKFFSLVQSIKKITYDFQNAKIKDQIENRKALEKSHLSDLVLKYTKNIENLKKIAKDPSKVKELQNKFNEFSAKYGKQFESLSDEVKTEALKLKKDNLDNLKTNIKTSFIYGSKVSKFIETLSKYKDNDGKNLDEKVIKEASLQYQKHIENYLIQNSSDSGEYKKFKATVKDEEKIEEALKEINEQDEKTELSNFKEKLKNIDDSLLKQDPDLENTLIKELVIDEKTQQLIKNDIKEHKTMNDEIEKYQTESIQTIKETEKSSFNDIKNDLDVTLHDSIPFFKIPFFKRISLQSNESSDQYDQLNFKNLTSKLIQKKLNIEKKKESNNLLQTKKTKLENDLSHTIQELKQESLKKTATNEETKSSSVSTDSNSLDLTESSLIKTNNDISLTSARKNGSSKRRLNSETESELSTLRLIIDSSENGKEERKTTPPKQSIGRSSSVSNFNGINQL